MMSQTHLAKYISIVFVLLILGGCANTSNYNSVTSLESTDNGKPKILVMPVDVELSILGATGITEVQAEWTKNAEQHIAEAVDEYLGTDKSKTLHYLSDSQDPAAVDIQLEKLHEAVGYSILVHQLGPLELPTRKGNKKWTLGEQARFLKDKTGADYALFMFVRDSYASAGRVAVQFAAALLGVGVTGGTQVGFSSLVDLNTGDIIWFNRLISTSGDLREIEPAKKTVKNLLDSIPTA